jgi:glycosyltransferase involved in cell wall biosynthesis
VEYVRENKDKYDFFIFFSYRYYHSYWGIKALPEKSILVPTAERDPVVGLRIFRELFRMPRAFVYNSVEERRMIQAVSGNEGIPGEVVGVGTEVPSEADGERFREKFGINAPYVIYVGRIDENKGCHKLFEYFLRYKMEEERAKGREGEKTEKGDARDRREGLGQEVGEGRIKGEKRSFYERGAEGTGCGPDGRRAGGEAGEGVKLVLVGSTVLKIPSHPDIHYLGFVSEQDKFDAIAGASVLVMPSFFESLSMVTLEAWAMRKPVLANAKCEVLKGQCLRSNAGLFYEDYAEFREALTLLLEDEKLRAVLGANGQKYYEANYTWEIIENKYLKIINALRDADKGK